MMMGQGRVTTRPFSQLLRDQVPLLALVAVCATTAALSDRFLSPVNLNNILLQASVMSVIVMGMTFVIIAGGFDLSVGSTVALSGTVAAWVMLETHWSVGVTAGIAAGAVVGYINGLIVARLRVNPFITTLGSMVVVRGIVLLITDGRPIVGDEGLPDRREHRTDDAADRAHLPDLAEVSVGLAGLHRCTPPPAGS